MTMSQDEHAAERPGADEREPDTGEGAAAAGPDVAGSAGREEPASGPELRAPAPTTAGPGLPGEQVAEAAGETDAVSFGTTGSPAPDGASGSAHGVDPDGARVGSGRAEQAPTTEGAADDADAAETSRPLDDQELRSALEAMLLVVDAPAPVELLAAAVDDSPARIERMLREMSAEWTARGSGIDLRYVGDGWRLYTRTEYAPYVERMLLDGARSKLTRAALETLAVIAYRQPVTRARVSAVRGVNVDGVIRTLVARGLIAEAGTDVDTNGTLYVTTELFLERIGLASLAELPPLAPLLPGVDLIDEINESLDTDPRYAKLKKPAESDIDLGGED